MIYLIILFSIFTSTIAYGHDCDRWSYSTLNIVRTESTTNAIWDNAKKHIEWNMLDTKKVSEMNRYFNIVSYSRISLLNSLGYRGWELASIKKNQKISGKQIDFMIFKKCLK
ncbi:MAG: hypothetical protein COA86_00225 [Kangiella sp.]|nr:MAG: hypothetical protein COA86_00225 [Kangiella sp.]